MSRALVIAAALAATRAFGFWGEVHSAYDVNIVEHGKWPAFARGTRQVDSVSSYLGNALYLDHTFDRELSGVHFNTPTCPPVPLPYLIPQCVYAPDKPTDAPNDRLTFEVWNSKQGGVGEDGFSDPAGGLKWGGLRAVNHFHVPISSNGHREGGFSGFLSSVNVLTAQPVIDILFRSGISAVDWANQQPSSNQNNYWGWPAAHQSLRRFFTEPPQAGPNPLINRERGLAAAARALGQVQHLIQDNAIPDHSRDLPHPGDGFEEYVKARTEHTQRPPSGWVTFPLKLIDQGGLRALWDRDLFGGLDPGTTLDDANNPAGISEYSNANFFAYNKLGPFKFTTIPRDQKAAGADFTWPQYQVDLGKHDYVSSLSPPSLKLDQIAHRGFNDPSANTMGQPPPDGPPYLDYGVWDEYAPPLIDHLLGYSFSTWPLLLPQARAEIVPDETEPMTHAKVRLWNLSPTSSPYAMTWKIDSVTVLPLLMQPIPNAVTANTEIAVDFAGASIAPQAYAESNSFVITAAQRTNFFFAPYTAVLVTAHLGQGQTQTPLEFGVPIPNGFPLLRQLDLLDTSTAGSIMATGCSGSVACGNSTTTGSVQEPYQQQLNLGLSLKAPMVDILDQPIAQTASMPSDVDVEGALLQDVRLAGLGVGAFVVNNGAGSITGVTWGSKSQLDGAPGSMVQVGSTLFVRPLNAPDTADVANGAELPLQLSLDFTDFVHSVADSAQAPSSTYLIVWTTSGAMYLQRLMVWPFFTDKNAATVASTIDCTGKGLTLNASLGTVASCNLSDTTNCISTVHSLAVVSAPFTGVQGYLGGPGIDDIRAAVTLTMLGNLKVLTAGGMNTTANNVGSPTTLCTATDYADMATGTSTKICNRGPGALAFKSLTQPGGDCKTPPPMLTVPRNATFAPLFTDDAFLWETVFGLPKNDEPNYTLTAH